MQYLLIKENMLSRRYDKSTIFTIGSLKASRTETDIATATIVIKTSCSIAAGVIGTG